MAASLKSRRCLLPTPITLMSIRYPFRSMSPASRGSSRDLASVAGIALFPWLCTA